MGWSRADCDRRHGSCFRVENSDHKSSREALGAELRRLRLEEAGLTRRQLAVLAELSESQRGRIELVDLAPNRSPHSMRRQSALDP